jgi:ubiquinol-cytochrome c reductase cytochrome c subunit
VTALAARRRHRLATPALLFLGLIITGLGYTAAVPGSAGAAGPDTEQVAAGKKLFQANCATCHGFNAEGRSNAPSLIGVGSAAVDFQVGTGRMPLEKTGPQAPAAPDVLFTPEQVAQLAAYIGSLGPGPAIPGVATVDPKDGNPSDGAMIFRTNCAMCHNFAGMGGALTRGKYAASLVTVDPKYVYEAMVSGPQSMPVFNDRTINQQGKRDIIAYLETIHHSPSPGGLALGSLGPVSEGLVVWVVGLVLLVGCAVWLGSKAA